MKALLKEKLQRSLDEVLKNIPRIIIEPLVQPFSFLLHDRSFEFIKECDLSQLIDFLSAQEALPEWVDIVLCDVKNDKSVFHVVYSDRYIEDLTHFNVKYPSFPKNLKNLMEEQQIDQSDRNLNLDLLFEFLEAHKFSIKDSPTYKNSRV